MAAPAKNPQSLPGVRLKIKKIERSASIDAADCGTVFMVKNQSGSDTGCVITLPSLAAAGVGWHCKFVNATNSTINSGQLEHDVRIQADSGADIMAVHTVDGAGSSAIAAGTPPQTRVDFNGGNASVHGDWLGVWTDGTYWYGEAWGGADASWSISA